MQNSEKHGNANVTDGMLRHAGRLYSDMAISDPVAERPVVVKVVLYLTATISDTVMVRMLSWQVVMRVGRMYVQYTSIEYVLGYELLRIEAGIGTGSSRLKCLDVRVRDMRRDMRNRMSMIHIRIRIMGDPGIRGHVGEGCIFETQVYSTTTTSG